MRRGNYRRHGAALVAGYLAIHSSLLPAYAADPVRMLNVEEPIAAETSASPPTPAAAPKYASAPDAEWTGPTVTAANERTMPVVYPPAPGLPPSLTSIPSTAAGPGPRLQADGPARAKNAPVVVRLTRYNRSSVAGRGDADPGSVLRVATTPDPAFNIIDCLAGCLPGRTRVYYAPRQGLKSAEAVSPAGSSLVSGIATVADNNAITCLAGCYATPKTYRAKPAGPRQQTAHAPVGEATTGGVVLAAAAMTITNSSVVRLATKRIKRLSHLAHRSKTNRGPHHWVTTVIRVTAPL